MNKNKKIQNIFRHYNRLVMSSPSPPVKVSKYFARGAPGTDGAFDDDGLAARGCISRPNSFHHPSFLECSRALELAVESFVNEAAKKKAEYDAHEAALATILAHAEGTIESKRKELEKEKEQRRREEKKTKTKKKTTTTTTTSVECDDGASRIDFGAPKNANKIEPVMKTKKRARGKASENF